MNQLIGLNVELCIYDCIIRPKGQILEIKNESLLFSDNHYYPISEIQSILFPKINAYRIKHKELRLIKLYRYYPKYKQYDGIYKSEPFGLMSEDSVIIDRNEAIKKYKEVLKQEIIRCCDELMNPKIIGEE